MYVHDMIAELYRKVPPDVEKPITLFFQDVDTEKVFEVEELIWGFYHTDRTCVTLKGKSRT